MDKTHRTIVEERLRDLAVDAIHTGTEVRWLVNNHRRGLTEGEQKHLMKTYNMQQEVIERLGIIRERCK